MKSACSAKGTHLPIPRNLCPCLGHGMHTCCRRVGRDATQPTFDMLQWVFTVISVKAQQRLQLLFQVAANRQTDTCNIFLGTRAKLCVLREKRAQVGKHSSYRCKQHQRSAWPRSMPAQGHQKWHVWAKDSPSAPPGRIGRPAPADLWPQQQYTVTERQARARARWSDPVSSEPGCAVATQMEAWRCEVATGFSTVYRARWSRWVGNVTIRPGAPANHIEGIADLLFKSLCVSKRS